MAGACAAIPTYTDQDTARTVARSMGGGKYDFTWAQASSLVAWQAARCVWGALLGAEVLRVGAAHGRSPEAVRACLCE